MVSFLIVSVSLIALIALMVGFGISDTIAANREAAKRKANAARIAANQQLPAYQQAVEAWNAARLAGNSHEAAKQHRIAMRIEAKGF